YAVQHATHEARERQRTEHAEGDTGETQQQSTTDHHAQHITRLRAEGDADADLPSALIYEIRQHTIDAQRTEHEPERPEQPEQHGEETRTRDRFVHDVVEREDRRNRLIAIERPNRVLNSP